VQPRGVLSHQALGAETRDDPVQASGVDAEPLAELADRDAGLFGHESQHILLALPGSRGAAA
jgi:hypothetical protein